MARHRRLVNEKYYVKETSQRLPFECRITVIQQKVINGKDIIGQRQTRQTRPVGVCHTRFLSSKRKKLAAEKAHNHRGLHSDPRDVEGKFWVTFHIEKPSMDSVLKIIVFG